MKKFLQIFALLGMFLMGTTNSKATVLTYDFMAMHPTADTSIEGRVAPNGIFAYWNGYWSGLFGKRIAFDATFPHTSLLGTGGLCDKHDHQKMYIKDLVYGDKVTVWFTGNNAELKYHATSTCIALGLSAGSYLVSGLQYTISSPGYMCLVNSYVAGEKETIITRIEIETSATTVNVNVQHGLATFCSNYPLDFSNANAKAYIATGFANGKVTFSEITYVPENVGIVVIPKDNSSSVSVPIGRGPELHNNKVPHENLLMGALESKTNYFDYNYNYYWIGKSNGKFKAFKISGSSFYVTKGTAYLKVPK